MKAPQPLHVTLISLHGHYYHQLLDQETRLRGKALEGPNKSSESQHNGTQPNASDSPELAVTFSSMVIVNNIIEPNFLLFAEG